MRLVLSKSFSHGGNVIVRWMCSNLVVTMDPAGNIKPDKERSVEKIDGMVALILALARGQLQPNTQGYRRSIFDRGVIKL
jgi:phage terminase large subunit-like protein